MDARLIQVYRGAMHLLAHDEREILLLDERTKLAALATAHEMWHLTEELLARQTITAVAESVDHARAA